MKMFVRQAIIAAVLLAVSSFEANAQLKIATVDLRNIFDNFWKTKQAEAVLKEKASELEADRKKMIDQYNKLKGDYKTAIERSNEQAVSAEEREKRKKSAEQKLGEMNELEATINQFDRQAGSNIDEQKRRMRENVLQEIRNVVNMKAKSGGYHLAIDSAAESVNGTPIVLFNESPENDLTKSVLAQLNETAPASRAIPGTSAPKDNK